MSVQALRFWEPVLDLRVFRGFRKNAIPGLRDRVTSFRLEDEKRKLDKAILVLDNGDGRLLDINSLALGIVFKVSFGYYGALSPPRLMQCRKMSGAIRLGGVGALNDSMTQAGGLVTLDLKSQVWNMNMQRALANFEGEIDRELLLQRTTIPNAVRAIAKRYGYNGTSLFVEDLENEEEIELGSIPAKFSAAEWVSDQAKRRDWVFKIDSDGFHFHSDYFAAASKKGLEEELGWFNGDPDVVRWNIEGDLNIPQNVNIRHGSIRNETFFSFSEVATEGGVTGRTLAVIKSGQKGRNQELSPNLMLSAASSRRQKEKVVNILNKAANRWVLKMQLVGNPKVRYGRRLNLKNFGPMVNGIWIVRKAIHTIRPNDVYFTEIDAIRERGPAQGKKQVIYSFGEVATEGGVTSRTSAIIEVTQQQLDELKKQQAS